MRVSVTHPLPGLEPAVEVRGALVFTSSFKWFFHRLAGRKLQTLQIIQVIYMYMHMYSTLYF